jgi:hypothetical protein
MTTQAKNNIIKPKTLTNGIVRYPLPHALIATTISQEPKPTCYSSTMKNPLWRKAMNVEFDALLHNQTWTLVPSSLAKNVIGCKWVFRLKRKVDGFIDQYKARFIAKVFHQQEGIDYGET